MRDHPSRHAATIRFNDFHVLPCLPEKTSLVYKVDKRRSSKRMAKMYHKEKSIQIKSSASALYNNLSVLRIAPRCLTYFTVVHANVVNMVSASWDGLDYSHRQLQSKEGSVATSSSLIMQVRRLQYHLSPNTVLYWFSAVLPTMSKSCH